jgi:hypothetical protein
MIFDDLQTSLVAALNNDAYFTEPTKLVRVMAENRMDLESELNASLLKMGVGGIVSVPSVVDGERGTEIIVRPTLTIYEIPHLNRASDGSGSGKTGFNIGVKAMTIWGHRMWTPKEDTWQKLEFKGLDLTDVDEKTGMVTWTLSYETRTYLEIVWPILGGEGANQILTDELGRALLVTPTDP